MYYGAFSQTMEEKYQQNTRGPRLLVKLSMNVIKVS